MKFACPYCGAFVEVTALNVTSVSAHTSVDDLTRFTVDFVTKHFRCKQPTEEMST